MAANFGDGLGGGVVLGADTRTSSGNYIANRATDKITQLTDKVPVLRLGSRKHVLSSTERSLK